MTWIELIVRIFVVFVFLFTGFVSGLAFRKTRDKGICEHCERCEMLDNTCCVCKEHGVIYHNVFNCLLFEPKDCNNGKWISVTDQMPYGAVLCVNVNHEYLIGYVLYDDQWGYYEAESNGVCPGAYGSYLADVTHWMPLPEPPQEVE